MKHCPKPNTPTVIGVNEDTGELVASKAGCGMWNCPYCSTVRKHYVARKCYLGIEHYKANGVPNWYFGTITMHENWRGWASLVNYQSNWNKFYQRMKRITNGPLYYCLLPEKHKDGSLHVHLISTCQAETRWFKDKGRASGFGYKNENEPLESSAAAVRYVTKYVGKSLSVVDWPKNFRRIRFSINWPEPPIRDDYTWSPFPPNLAKYAVRVKFEQGYDPTNYYSKERVIYEPHLRDSIRRQNEYDSAVQQNADTGFCIENSNLPGFEW